MTTPVAKYWYLTTIMECILCGGGNSYRQRSFTPRPEAWAARHEHIDFACDGHFA